MSKKRKDVLALLFVVALFTSGMIVIGYFWYGVAILLVTK